MFILFVRSFFVLLLAFCLEFFLSFDISSDSFSSVIEEIFSSSFSSKEETLSTEENIITLLQAIVSTIEFQFG